MKIEVGKTYINNRRNEVKIVAVLERPLSDFEKLIGIETLEGGMELPLNYNELGEFVNKPDHEASLKYEKGRE
jgi:hypothetical protein